MPESPRPSWPASPYVSPGGIRYLAPDTEPREDDPAQSVETKPRRPTAPPRAPGVIDADVYSVCGLTPKLVQGLRPRWTLERARNWLVAHEAHLLARCRQDMVNAVQVALSRTVGRTLRRDTSAIRTVLPWSPVSPGQGQGLERELGAMTATAMGDAILTPWFMQATTITTEGG